VAALNLKGDCHCPSPALTGEIPVGCWYHGVSRRNIAIGVCVCRPAKRSKEKYDASMKRNDPRFFAQLASPGIKFTHQLLMTHSPAKIAERVGFRLVGLGGYSLGASSCVPEPLLSLEEVISPLADHRSRPTFIDVDGGAGFGVPT